MKKKYLDIDGLRYFWNNVKLFVEEKYNEIINALGKLVTEEEPGLMSSLDKIKINHINVGYGSCNTSGSKADKIITLQQPDLWRLEIGSIVIVKFSATNTASNPTLNVNNTGAFPVIYNTSKITTSSVSYAGYLNRTIKYMYNGTGYVYLGWSYNTSYSGMTESEANTGTSSTNRLISPKILSNKINSVVESATNNLMITKYDHGVTNTTHTILPNTFNKWGEVDALDITLADEIDGIYNEYLIQFSSGDIPTTLSLPDNILWINDEPINIESNKTYQISIVDNLACILTFKYTKPSEEE